MKRIFTAIPAAALLLCLAGCTSKEPPGPATYDGPLPAEELLGTYDISYQSETESGSRAADLRLVNERLTFALYPDMELSSEHSFNSYDPETGRATWEQSRQTGRTVSCELIFTETDGRITVSGSCTVTREDEAKESYTLSGEMIEKL